VQFIKRKEAEAALLESEERYRDLFENATDLIQCVTADGSFVYVNQAWRDTLGYNEAEIAELKIFDVIHSSYNHNVLIFSKSYVWREN
jgi:PAS domain S-box-containing protein